MKIILGAVISQPPFSPGMAWNWMHHAVGFHELGHDVYFVEEVRPEWATDANGEVCPFEESANRELFVSTMARFGLVDRSCQVFDSGKATTGLSFDSFLHLAKDADVLINMSGHVTSESILERARRRVYVDQDPVYTQLWNAEYGKDLNFKSHDVFLTVGLNMGTPATSVPDCGITWRHVLPPVVMDYWPMDVDHSPSRFTTVASWSGFGDLCYRGEWYRSKYEEFQRFAALPSQVEPELEVALKSFRENDLGIQMLRKNKWILADAGRIANLGDYQDYITRSRGEIGIAKNAYVRGRSGWFSDRSAHYLAAGRPVLAQSTGFERCLPTGEGLLTFGTMDEAVLGIESIHREYARHCRAAREFAREYLDHRTVLTGMLEHCGAGNA